MKNFRQSEGQQQNDEINEAQALGGFPFDHKEFPEIGKTGQGIKVTEKAPVDKLGERKQHQDGACRQKENASASALFEQKGKSGNQKTDGRIKEHSPRRNQPETAEKAQYQITAQEAEAVSHQFRRIGKQLFHRIHYTIIAQMRPGKEKFFSCPF